MQNSQQRPYQQQQARKLDCFWCGEDHFVRDCPYDKPPLNHAVGPSQQFATVPQYCKDCAIEHLSKDCPNKPVVSTAPVGKTGLNLVEIIPSPTISETELEIEIIPLRVITRTQARVQQEESNISQTQQQGDEDKNTKKRRGRPRKEGQEAKNHLGNKQPERRRYYEGYYAKS